MSNLPKGWELKTLGELSKVKRGASPRPINDPKWWGGDIGWVRISDLTASTKFLNKTKDKLSSEGVQKSVRINKGEVILSICATIGRPIIVNTEVCIHDGFVWFDKLSEKVDREYFYYFLSKKEKELSASRQIGTQGNLNTDIVSRLMFPLPPLEEQKKIADILSTVDKKIAFVEENINATEELKKGLMQKLLTEGIGHTEFKDSELGRIPESWEIKRLNSICNKITDGSHFSPIPNKNTGFYIATVKDMLSNTFNINTCTHIEENDFKLLEINGCKPEIGDILFSKDGTIGKTFVYKDMKIPLVVLSSIAIIKPISKVLDSLFTMHVLKSNIFYKQLNGLSSGSALKRVVLKAIKEIKIPFPPLEEQKQIAEILSTVDNKLENLKEKKQYFEELKKGLMQKLLTGKIRV
ncbi:restriction endonuclease subunit S [Aliarcobacter butzleri]|uniref:restriction endonuclease subunit S n=1 Tax=Aliarcobacter butzleri TaxID=28197 RepID=UPI001EDBF0FF|nr:restriction endonuclease subunit S [Aliarcobacter butzleri]MCG3710110.1 restriction endonuclease subunit S [Aliarcobacter butzleri]MCG3714501.1 restriction endonuclease subunit S [Aliarcobacter butzleri]